ncbi:MAG: DUF1573 domain-containing protein [Segetibacter sp.]
MKRVFKKTWFQVMFFGVIIGGLLIFVDSNYNLFHLGEEKKPELYNGAIREKTDEMYFTKAEYPEITYDFGKVKEGDTVMHKFIIKNRGNEPLMIFKTKGSCDCIKAFHSEKPVMPGTEAEIGVYFKTTGRKGHQLRTVNINTNTDPADATLTFMGEVE